MRMFVYICVRVSVYVCEYVSLADRANTCTAYGNSTVQIRSAQVLGQVYLSEPRQPCKPRRLLRSQGTTIRVL